MYLYSLSLQREKTNDIWVMKVDLILNYNQHLDLFVSKQSHLEQNPKTFSLLSYDKEKQDIKKANFLSIDYLLDCPYSQILVSL